MDLGEDDNEDRVAIWSKDETLLEMERRANWSRRLSIFARAGPEPGTAVDMAAVSALSVALGLWMLLWLGLLLATPFSPLLIGLAFLGRHFTGVAFVAFWLIRSRRLDLLPFALIYEPAAILTGLAVMWDARTQRKVEWGGVDYPQ